jgi:hypothetical protein
MQLQKVSCPTLFTSSSRQRSLASQRSVCMYVCMHTAWLHHTPTLSRSLAVCVMHRGVLPPAHRWLLHPATADRPDRFGQTFTISILTRLFKSLLELSLLCVCQAITEGLVQLHRARTVGSNTGCRINMWCASFCSSVTNRSPRKTQWVLMELTPCSLVVNHQQPPPSATS